MLYLAFLDKIVPGLQGWKTEILIVLGLLCFGFNLLLSMLKMPQVNEIHAAGIACLVLAVGAAQDRKTRMQGQIEDLKTQVQPADDGK
jgi:hypothetical protein